MKRETSTSSRPASARPEPLDLPPGPRSLGRHRRAGRLALQHPARLLRAPVGLAAVADRAPLQRSASAAVSCSGCRKAPGRRTSSSTSRSNCRTSPACPPASARRARPRRAASTRWSSRPRTRRSPAPRSHAARDLVMAAIDDRPFDVAADRRASARRRSTPTVSVPAPRASSTRPTTATFRDPADRRQSGAARLRREQRRIWTAETDRTSAIAESIARDKDLTKRLLASCGVPVPEGRLVESAAGRLGGGRGDRPAGGGQADRRQPRPRRVHRSHGPQPRSRRPTTSP